MFGAADAASGTAAMLEVAKGLYTLKQTYLPLLDFFHSPNVSFNVSLFSSTVKWLATSQNNHSLFMVGNFFSRIKLNIGLPPNSISIYEGMLRSLL